MNRLRKHFASYKYAVNGIMYAFRNESNMLFHLLAAATVIAINYMLNVAQHEWLITLILIGLAWMAELFNTAIEKLCDRVTKDQDPVIGAVKDLASGAVLIICFFAAICSLIIYLPYIVR